VTRAPLDKVIITRAITGNLTLPGATPHLPVSPAQIASSALGAADAQLAAGARSVHRDWHRPLDVSNCCLSALSEPSKRSFINRRSVLE